MPQLFALLVGQLGRFLESNLQVSQGLALEGYRLGNVGQPAHKALASGIPLRLSYQTAPD